MRRTDLVAGKLGRLIAHELLELHVTRCPTIAPTGVADYVLQEGL